MNNLVFFKGGLVGIETKNLENGSTMHRIEIEVEEFYFDHVEKIKHPVKNKYFLTKFNWKEANFFASGEYYFIGRVVYKRVESKKGKNEDGTPFKYGTFDFTLDVIAQTKEEARDQIVRILGIY